MTNVDKISTSKSIPEMNDEGLGDLQNNVTHLDESLLNTSIQSSLLQSKSEKKSMRLQNHSKDKTKIPISKKAPAQDLELNQSEDFAQSINLLTVNSKNQLIYTLLCQDKDNITKELICTRTVATTFREIITTMVHFPLKNGIILCGSPHVFFWDVPHKQLLFKCKIEIPIEPWFSIWDAIYISVKKCLILGLNNGFVVQLKLNNHNYKKTEQVIFQSNEEGIGIYSLAYFPSLQKIIAANGHNLLTEFMFHKPKKANEKELMLSSNKNISDFLLFKDNKFNVKSYKHISLNSSLTFLKMLNSDSTKKNK